MGQFFTDDIDALLKSGHGDYGRLSRIKSDFEAKKLVTMEDRRYVDGLISRYLQPATQTEKPERIVKIPEKRIVPPPPAPVNVPEMKQQKTVVEKPIEKMYGKKKMRNVVISVASVIFAVLIISVVAMNQDSITLTGPGASKTLETDQTSYARGDIISISGSTEAAIIKLTISDPDAQEVWTEIVKVKTDGTFSTLVIAGGTGWEKVGKYTLTSSVEGKTEKTDFDFSPSEAP
ncbi:MAG: hypothetical protein EPO62_01320 [Candidatus Nitrosotenuis sp.]|nr:MAG: hypothetical protein EPO62_01320 [Candidatus Nitrosotenuis sp.]